jgi:hypothetical protein
VAHNNQGGFFSKVNITFQLLALIKKLNSFNHEKNPPDFLQAENELQIIFIIREGSFLKFKKLDKT